MTPIEVQEAAAIVEELADPEANIVWGMTLDEAYDDEVKVTVIATGFTSYEENTSLKKPQRDELGRKVGGGSQDFVSRTLGNNNPFGSTGRNQEVSSQEPEEEQEDYETPAFMRKKI